MYAVHAWPTAYLLCWRLQIPVLTGCICSRHVSPIHPNPAVGVGFTTALGSSTMLLSDGLQVGKLRGCCRDFAGRSCWVAGWMNCWGKRYGRTHSHRRHVQLGWCPSPGPLPVRPVAASCLRCVRRVRHKRMHHSGLGSCTQPGMLPLLHTACVCCL